MMAEQEGMCRLTAGISSGNLALQPSQVTMQSCVGRLPVKYLSLSLSLSLSRHHYQAGGGREQIELL